AMRLNALDRGWDKDAVANAAIGLDYARAMVRNGNMSSRDYDELEKAAAIDVISNAMSMESYVAMRKSGQLEQVLDQCADADPRRSVRETEQHRKSLVSKVAADFAGAANDAGNISDEDYIGILRQFDAIPAELKNPANPSELAASPAHVAAELHASRL